MLTTTETLALLADKPDHVVIERIRHSYHTWPRWGVRDSKHTVDVVPLSRAFDYVSGSSEFVYVTYPDGATESFDLAVQPARFSSSHGTTERVLSVSGCNEFEPDGFCNRTVSRLGRLGYHGLTRETLDETNRKNLQLLRQANESFTKMGKLEFVRKEPKLSA